MKEHVTIYGASTLDRYTKGILAQGFLNNSWRVEVNDSAQKVPAADAVLFQIHGSPQAVEEDKKISDKISSAIVEQDSSPLVVLVHRPDEVQILHPDFNKMLSGSSRKIGLVLLGDKHIDDDFFKAEHVVRKVIPHGFFDLSNHMQIDPIVIGTNTTWGEMRSTEHSLKLLAEVFRLNPNSKVVGYLGGKPGDQLDIDLLTETANRVASNVTLKFVDLNQMPFEEATKQSGNLVLVQTGDQSDDFSLTFNTQMYFLGSKVRTGESSGSVHISSGVPVILEMNGSERIEDLEVIKVPYTDVSDIGSVDYKAGAEKVAEVINNRSFTSMLEHNAEQAKKFNNTFVAKQYIDLFNKLNS